MVRPDLHERLRRSKLERYLLAGEHEVLAQHQHWAAFAEPLASAVAGLFVVLALDSFLLAELGVLVNLLWWAWLVLCGRAIWKVFLWRQSWLVATDKRLLLNYGLFNQGVAMLSLSRVVDLTYTRSTLGQLLGYGTLERESSGHNQTLHDIKWVKHPHSTYLTICAAIFGLDDRERGSDTADQSPDGGQHPHTANRYSGFAPSPNEPDPTGYSTGIRIRPAGSLHSDESWRQNPSLGESDIHEADTGPIPYRRPTTDDGWRPTTDERDR